jgi:hypothetical protein
MINIDRAYKEKLYFVYGDGTMRTVPIKDGKDFASYRKMDEGDFELRPEGDMLNEEVIIAFTNSLTIEISEEDYHNKTEGELHDLYMEQSLNKLK